MNVKKSSEKVTRPTRGQSPVLTMQDWPMIHTDPPGSQRVFHIKGETLVQSEREIKMCRTRTNGTKDPQQIS